MKAPAAPNIADYLHTSDTQRIHGIVARFVNIINEIY